MEPRYGRFLFCNFRKTFVKNVLSLRAKTYMFWSDFELFSSTQLTHPTPNKCYWTLTVNCSGIRTLSIHPSEHMCSLLFIFRLYSAVKHAVWFANVSLSVGKNDGSIRCLLLRRVFLEFPTILLQYQQYPLLKFCQSIY